MYWKLFQNEETPLKNKGMYITTMYQDDIKLETYGDFRLNWRLTAISGALLIRSANFFRPSAFLSGPCLNRRRIQAPSYKRSRARCLLLDLSALITTGTRARELANFLSAPAPDYWLSRAKSLFI